MPALTTAAAQAAPQTAEQGQQTLASTWSDTATVVTESEDNGDAGGSVLWDLATRLLRECNENRLAVERLGNSLRSVSENASARLNLLNEAFEKAEQLQALVTKLNQELGRQRVRSRQQDKEIATLNDTVQKLRAEVRVLKMEIKDSNEDIKSHMSAEMEKLQQRMDARGALPAFLQPPQFLLRFWGNHA